MRCPVCKVENAEGSQCRRCKADLSLLFELERHRDALFAAAIEAVRRGRLEEALAEVERAHRLRHGDDTGRLLAQIHLLRYDFQSTWRQYRRVCGELVA
jgi:hypothetical protein